MLLLIIYTRIFFGKNRVYIKTFFSQLLLKLLLLSNDLFDYIIIFDIYYPYYIEKHFCNLTRTFSCIINNFYFL